MTDDLCQCDVCRWDRENPGVKLPPHSRVDRLTALLEEVIPFLESYPNLDGWGAPRPEPECDDLLRRIRAELYGAETPSTTHG